MEVEGDAQGIRPFFLFQAQQRGEKAEHGVGVQPFPVSQGADAVIGPVDDGITVYDHALHGKTSGDNRIIGFIIPHFPAIRNGFRGKRPDFSARLR